MNLHAYQDTLRQELDYLDYRKAQVAKAIAAMPPQDYQHAIDNEKSKLQNLALPDHVLTERALTTFRKQLAAQLKLMSFKRFCEANRPGPRLVRRSGDR